MFSTRFTASVCFPKVKSTVPCTELVLRNIKRESLGCRGLYDRQQSQWQMDSLVLDFMFFMIFFLQKSMDIKTIPGKYSFNKHLTYQSIVPSIRSKTDFFS